MVLRRASRDANHVKPREVDGEFHKSSLANHVDYITCSMRGFICSSKKKNEKGKSLEMALIYGRVNAPLVTL